MINWFISATSLMAFFWLCAAVVFGIIEAATVGLVTIWFAVGALAALVAAGLGAALWLQIVVFLIVSALMLALLRPMLKKFVTPHKTATNADRHIGRTAFVTEEINNLRETGAVKLDGITWTARAEGGEIIPVDSLITVKEIRGVKLIVTKAAQPGQPENT